MKVKQLLKVMDSKEPVNVIIYAYGFAYASTWADGMRTAEDVKTNLIYDGMNADILQILNGGDYITIKASMTK